MATSISTTATTIANPTEPKTAAAVAPPSAASTSGRVAQQITTTAAVATAATGPRMSATPVNGATSGDMLGIVCEQATSERQHLGHPVIGDAVVDSAVLTPGEHEAAPTQAGKVFGDFRLRKPESVGQLADRKFLLFKLSNQTKTRRVAERPEVLGYQIERGRLLSDPERRRSKGFHHMRNIAYEALASRDCGWASALLGGLVLVLFRNA